MNRTKLRHLERITQIVMLTSGIASMMGNYLENPDLAWGGIVSMVVSGELNTYCKLRRYADKPLH